MRQLITMHLSLYLLILLILSVASSSCGPLISSRPTTEEPSFYCRVLHVPEERNALPSPRPFLGVMMKPARLDRTTYGECNMFVQVDGLIGESPAVRAGFKEDDVILSIGGDPICSETEDVLRRLELKVAGVGIDKAITIAILRGDSELPITVYLEEMPNLKQTQAVHEGIEICPDTSSMLKERLISDEALSRFNDILSGLYNQSNYVHNPSWLSKREANPYQLKEFTYMLRHPLHAGEVAGELAGRVLDNINSELNTGRIIQETASLLDVDFTPSACPGLTVPLFKDVIEKVGRDIDGALQGISEEDRSFIRKNLIKDNDKGAWNRLIELSLMVELKELLTALNPLISCLNEEGINHLREDIIKRFKGKTPLLLYEEETPYGKIIIGGTGRNIYTDDAALILDIGGDDIYLNNAGGTRLGIPVSVVIDWDGDDHYLTKEGFSQGAGVLGGGFLIDLGGKDIFSTHNGGQGMGFFGVGILINKGKESILKAGRYAQGIGAFGIGILLNRDGGTTYQSTGYGQGLGLFNGVGIVIDDSGNDNYMLGGLEADFRDPEHSTVSMGQGFGKGVRPERGITGVSGGIGMLIDVNGDDTYVADYFAQGASYYYATGILNDNAGDDRYVAGRYAQGAGIHSSVGVLIDNAGNDLYYTSYGVSQGMGHDYGVGFLDDHDGDDRYLGGLLSQGAATKGGTGIVIDRKGIDLYNAEESGQGYAHG